MESSWKEILAAGVAVCLIALGVGGCDYLDAKSEAIKASIPKEQTK